MQTQRTRVDGVDSLAQDLELTRPIDEWHGGDSDLRLLADDDRLQH
jgi:hypothetical protein